MHLAGVRKGCAGEDMPEENGTTLVTLKSDGSLKFSKKAWMVMAGLLLGTSFLGPAGVAGVVGMGRRAGTLEDESVEVIMSAV